MTDLQKLAEFLVRAKIQTYAGDGKEVEPQRPGFNELEYSEDDFEYRDSYAGFYCAPGQEVVRFNGKPIWAMAYNGGMIKKYQDDEAFSGMTFAFLKEALKRVDKSRPFRGPESFKDGDFGYVDETSGDITLFNGCEKIFYKDEEVFRQRYFGGIILGK